MYTQCRLCVEVGGYGGASHASGPGYGQNMNESFDGEGYPGGAGYGSAKGYGSSDGNYGQEAMAMVLKRVVMGLAQPCGKTRVIWHSGNQKYREMSHLSKPRARRMKGFKRVVFTRTIDSYSWHGTANYKNAQLHL